MDSCTPVCHCGVLSKKDKTASVKTLAIKVNIDNNLASNVVYIAVLSVPKISLSVLVRYYWDQFDLHGSIVCRLGVSRRSYLLVTTICAWFDVVVDAILGSIWLDTFRTRVEQWCSHKPVKTKCIAAMQRSILRLVLPHSQKGHW